MRSYIALIGLALIMAFLAGTSLLWMRMDQRTVSNQDIISISKMKLAFQETVSPIAIINLSSYYFTNHHFKLMSPNYSLPSFEHEQPEYYARGENCFQGMQDLRGLYGHEKILIWEEFRCGIRTRLPQAFFETSPYMHPSGVSFLYLAYLTGKREFRTAEWVLDNIPLFHLRELKNISEIKGRIGGIFLILSELSDDEIESLSKGQGTILTSRYMLAKLSYPNEPSILEYRVYDRDDLDMFLKNSDYILGKYRSKRICFYRDEQLCWSPNASKVLERLNLSQVIIFMGGLFVMALALAGLVGRLKDDKVEEERKRLALQTLTHELRTPITSLMLESENLSRHMEKFDDDVQDSIIRLNSEVHRLKRLTETSRQYLRVGKSKNTLESNTALIPSINGFLTEVAEPFSGPGLLLKLCAQDCSFKTDPYWLAIMVKNLLENAFNHGIPPVEMWAEVLPGKLIVSISDQGDGKDIDSKNFGEEFKKGNKSTGTGLGLSIVKRVAKALGGELKFTPSPCTFTLVLREQKSNS